MDRGRKPVILVGVSGSCASLAALAWAAREARRRDARLRVIQAWQPHPARALYAGAGLYRGQNTAEETLTESVAASRLVADVRSVLGDEAAGNINPELAEGAAERVLTGASAAADLLVLGAGAQSVFAHHDPAINDRPVGPVIRACLIHARCPVVVIGPSTAEEPAMTAAAGTRA